MSETAEAAKARKRKGDSPREPTHVKLDWAFVGFLALSPLLLGGTHPVFAVALALGGVAFVLADFGLRLSANEPVRVPDLAWLLLAVVVFAVLRNTAVLGFISPGIVREGFDLWPEIVARGTASPGRTALWSMKMLGVISALYYAANRFRRSDKVWKLAIAIIGAGLVTASLGVAQELLNAEGHLFIYTPIDWDRIVLIGGPFVNPNQAGSLAALAAVVSFGIGHQQAKLKFRVLFIACGLFLSGYTVITGASAATLSLVLSTFALLLAIMFTRSHDENTVQRRLIVGLPLIGCAILGVLIVLIVLPLDAVPGATKSAEKLALWRQSAHAIGHGPLFGFGASSFQDIFPYFDTMQRNELARNVESGTLQFLIEQGLIPFMVLCTSLVILAVRTAKDSRLAKRFVFPSFIGISTFLILDISFGMGLQSQSYAMIVGALIGGIAGRPKKAGLAARRGLVNNAGVAVLFVLVGVSLLGISNSVRVSLNDSEVPYAGLDTIASIAPAIDTEAHDRPLNIVVLSQTMALRLATDEIELADRIAGFLTSHVGARKMVWRAAFRVAQDERSTLEECTLVNRYWVEFGELPREAVDFVRRQPAFTECILDREPADQCRFLGQLLPQLPSDERFLLVNRMMESEHGECVLAAAVKLSNKSEFLPLADVWVRELIAMNGLQADTHLTLAEYYRSERNFDEELGQLLAAREILDDNAEIGLAVLRSLLGIVRREQPPEGWYQRFTAYAEAVRMDTFDDSRLSTELRRLGAEAAYLAEDLETARHEFETLRNAGTDRDRANTFLFLARIARTEGRYRDAINSYRMTLRFHPQNREARQALEDLNATVR